MNWNIFFHNAELVTYPQIFKNPKNHIQKTKSGIINYKMILNTTSNNRNDHKTWISLGIDQNPNNNKLLRKWKVDNINACLNTNGRIKIIKSIVGEREENAALSDTGVPNQQHLKQVIKLCIWGSLHPSLPSISIYLCL